MYKIYLRDAKTKEHVKTSDYNCECLTLAWGMAIIHYGESLEPYRLEVID